MQDISAENLRLTNFLLHILGMFPFSTDISTKNVTYVFYVIIVNFGFAFVVYVEVQGRVLAETGASTIIRSIASIILGFANVGLTITINLSKKSRCGVIVNKLKNFDDFLVDNFYIKQKTSKAGVIVMIAIHVFYIYMIAAEVFMWKKSGWDVILYNVVGNILRYRLDIFVCCVYFFINELHARIKYTNHKLRSTIEKMRTNYMKKKFSIANTTFYMCQIPDITKNTSKAYATVTDVIEIFNKVFGWLLLVLMMNYLLVCIIAFSLGLRFKSLEEVNWIHFVWLISFTLGALVYLWIFNIRRFTYYLLFYFR